jgi:hypothetical protein
VLALAVALHVGAVLVQLLPQRPAMAFLGTAWVLVVGAIVIERHRRQ